MSLQRAQVNCTRCHEIASMLACYEMSGSTRMLRYTETAEARFGSEALYAARNQAMIALEESDCELSRSCLDICLSCDYSSPKIVEKIKGDRK